MIDRPEMVLEGCGQVGRTEPRSLRPERRVEHDLETLTIREIAAATNTSKAHV
jgi:hypothetical protein